MIRKDRICILYYVALLFIFTSCNSYFNSKYYSYLNAGSGTEDPSVPDDGGDEEGGGDEVEGPDSPFLEENGIDINYNGFDGSSIKNWALKVSFDSKNVPSYSFKTSGVSWKAGNKDKAEYTYDGSGDGNKAQGYGISPMTLYKYEGKNPLATPNGNYNKSSRLGRFVFFRFSGKAVVVDLDNYLIAVDTYSKLVFAYAKITGTTSVLGQDVPATFQSVEQWGDKKKFYQYDPIGIVHKDGKLELYEEYWPEMSKSAVNFFPSIHNDSREVASYGKPGSSPYKDAASGTAARKGRITIRPMYFKNISTKSSQGYLNWGVPTYDIILNSAYFTYGIAGSAFNENFPPESPNFIVGKNTTGWVLGAVRPWDALAQIECGKSLNWDYNMAKVFEIEDMNDCAVELTANIYKWNTLSVITSPFDPYVDNNNFGKGRSGRIATTSDLKVRLKYNAKKDSIVFDAKNSVMGNIIDGNITSVRCNVLFSVRSGGYGDLVLRYVWDKTGEQLEVCYRITYS